jgi:hypothetical protein
VTVPFKDKESSNNFVAKTKIIVNNFPDLAYDPKGPVPFPKGGIDLDDFAVLNYNFLNDQIKNSNSDTTYLLFCDEIPDNPFKELSSYIETLKSKVPFEYFPYLSAEITVPLHSLLKYNINNSMNNNNIVDFCKNVDIDSNEISSINLKIKFPKITSSMSSLSCTITMTKKIEIF